MVFVLDDVSNIIESPEYHLITKAKHGMPGELVFVHLRGVGRIHQCRVKTVRRRRFDEIGEETHANSPHGNKIKAREYLMKKHGFHDDENEESRKKKLRRFNNIRFRVYKLSVVRKFKIKM
jgi:hypothetical protein